nr:hypothetical protein [Tanacetum cinerariifolium]
MSTRSFARNLFPPLDNPELAIQRRSRSNLTLLNNSEMAVEGPGDLPVPNLQTINSCQFHGLPSDDANKHLDKFLHVTRSIKVNGVIDDSLRFYLFPHSLTHHAIAWFDRLPRSSISTFEKMAKMFLGKYFPPSMVTKLRNKITNFRQRPDESLFKAWECYKLSIDRCPNHNMFPVTQIDTFYNGLTLRHRDTINAATGGTFMKRPLKAEMAKINKNLMRVLQVNHQVKAVTLNCETFGGPHSFSDCRAIVGNTKNVYAAGAYQGNSYQPQGNHNLLSYHSDNYLGPLGFNQNQSRNNQNHNFQNQNRNQGNHNPQGNNQGRHQFFQGANQGQNQPLAYQAPAYQAPVYQALVHQPQIPQPQVVTTNEFTNFIKANDAILKNMQTNMTSLTNLNLELKNMFDQFVKMNTASSFGLGTLLSNTITNPKEDLKGITTRSGTAYQGPTIPTTSSSLPSIVDRETEVTKDTMHSTNNGSTKDIQPSIVLIESPILKSEPVISPIIEPVSYPVSAPRPNQRPLIPYPSRLHDQKLCNKANDQREKFFQIFKDLNFNNSFSDALILMPKFGPSIKSLLTNNDKLCELARTPLNKHCSAVLLKKLPEKLVDPDKFLISCDFPEMAKYLALADLGASINLMPLSVWNNLSLLDLASTCMTLELADRSISRSVGVVEDVFVKVGTFHFPADFVVVDFDANPQVPLILGRSFLKTIRALIDVFEEYSQEVLGFSDVIASGNLTPHYDPIVSTTSLTLTLFGNSDFLLEEVDAFLALEDDPTLPEVDQSYVDTEGDILLLEAFLNDDPLLPLQIKKIICLKFVELKYLPPHLECAFLEGNDKFPVLIGKDLSVEEKTSLITVLKSHKRAIAWKLSDIKEKMLKRCEDTNLCLNWEKSHFMVKEGIVLGHKISKEGIEVDKAKVDVITKLPHPTIVKGIRSFLVHAGFYRRFIQDFSKIARPMTCLLEKDTSFLFSKECVEAFQTLKRKLTKASILIAPDWDMPFELMCDAIDFAIGAVLGQRQEKHFRPIHYANRVFNIGDRVLLFNSRLKIFSGKLKSRWSRPFTISHVFLYGTVELSQPDGPNFKVNGHGLKHYFGEDVPKVVVPDLQTFPKDK